MIMIDVERCNVVNITSKVSAPHLQRLTLVHSLHKMAAVVTLSASLSLAGDTCFYRLRDWSAFFLKKTKYKRQKCHPYFRVGREF